MDNWYLVSGDSSSQSTFHHALQRLLFALGLSCQLCAAVSKPCYVVLSTQTVTITSIVTAGLGNCFINYQMTVFVHVRA